MGCGMQPGGVSQRVGGCIMFSLDPHTAVHMPHNMHMHTCMCM
jgi:hypothetical protein